MSSSSGKIVNLKNYELTNLPTNRTLGLAPSVIDSSARWITN